MGKTTVSKNLKRLLKLRGVSQTDMARALDFNESTVSSWISGAKYPRRDKIEMMADYFNVKPSDITDEKEKVDNVIQIPVKPVPVVSKVSAGIPVYAEQNIVDYVYVSESMLKPNKEYFGLIVDGDSMNNEFRHGDVVIIEKDSTVENGQIAVVQINGYEATLKQVNYHENTITLLPNSTNPEHKPQFYNKNDEVHIIGRVVGLNRNY